MDEYINREQLIGELKDVIADYKDENTFSTDFAATIVTDILNNIVKCHPAADVAPVRHGRWLYHTLIGGHIHAECSECHKIRIIDNFCHNCGAKMDSYEC